MFIIIAHNKIFHSYA